MSMKRRSFLKGAVTGGAVAVGASLFPQIVMAEWPKAAFEAKTIDDALSNLLGGKDLTESGDITIKAPDIAENGAVVPITISTGMADVESVSVISENNPVPLVASFAFTGFAGEVSTRIKMGKTGNVVAVVKAGGKLYTAKKEVKVTIGGCGG